MRKGGDMKLKKSGRYFFLSLTLAFMLTSLAGCVAPGPKSHSGLNYKNPPRPQLEKYSGDKVALDSNEAPILNSPPEMTGAELERAGDILFSRGNLHMASVKYTKSLKLDPDNTRVLYKIGRLFVIGRLNADAVQVFEEVLKREPEHALSYKGLGRAHFQMKQYDQAAKKYQKALKLDPNLWQAHNSLGIIHDYQEKYELAAYDYSQAILLKPDEGLLYNNLGVSYFLAGEYQKAINAFNEALARKYSKKKVFNNLGLALAKLERYQSAFGAFVKGGDEAQAYNNMGCVHLEQGDAKKAIHSFEKAIEVNTAFYGKASENLKHVRLGYEQYQ